MLFQRFKPMRQFFLFRRVLQSVHIPPRGGGRWRRPAGLLLGLSLLSSLSGCVPLLIGGGAAATGAVLYQDRRTFGAMMDDSTIERTAASEFKKDWELANPVQVHINVTSYNHVVLLTGEVATAAQRKRAADIVRQLPNVKVVYNELVIGPISMTDERARDAAITAQVKAALTPLTQSDFNPTHVKVVTERRVVYLLGLLRPEEAEAVVEQARYVDGVQQVVKLFESIPSATEAGAAGTRATSPP